MALVDVNVVVALAWDFARSSPSRPLELSY